MRNIDNPMASATPDDSPNQTINSLLCDGTILIGYGKPGHGMNGKHADLDRVGQCLVKNLVTVDPVGAATMRVDIHLHLYACVCAPSGQNIQISTVRKNASPDLKEYFRGIGVDIDTLEDEINADTPEAWEKFGKVVGHFQEQAGYIAEGANPCPDDPFAFMWNDECWEGGTDITLTVPLTVDEYDSIEALRGVKEVLISHRRTIGDAALNNDPKAIRAATREFAATLQAEAKGNKILKKVARRIAKEIYDGNKGGTPERDKMKHFEEEVGLWNDLISKLECYG
jgi:hypothetical protein